MRLSRAKKGQIIDIEWVDSCQNGGWQPEKEIEDWADVDAVATHHTVGYFVKVTDRVLVLVSSYANFENGYRSVTGSMSIPLVSILNSRLVQ